jgi:hypothetical protein
LTEALRQPEERPEAAETLRLLIGELVLGPGLGRGEIVATLHGELGTLPDWTGRQAVGKAPKTTKPAAGATGL